MKVIRVSAIWCPSCLMMKTIWNEVEQELPEIEYIDYDYDFDASKVEPYEVGNILPVLIICDDELNEIKRMVGEHTKKELLEFLR